MHYTMRIKTGLEFDRALLECWTAKQAAEIWKCSERSARRYIKIAPDRVKYLALISLPGQRAYALWLVHKKYRPDFQRRGNPNFSDSEYQRAIAQKRIVVDRMAK
jgi:hypothetical protein